MAHGTRHLPRLVNAGILCCLLTAGCRPSSPQRAATPPAASAAPPGVTLENGPGIDGSASTSLLVKLLQSRMAGLSGEIRRSGGRGRDRNATAEVVFPLETDADQTLMYRSYFAGFQNQGTHDAYVALIEGRIDTLVPQVDSAATSGARWKAVEMLLVVREPSPNELALAKKHGVELDVRPVARDALVFLAHRDNPATHLTIEQIRDIYTGKTTNWSALGGTNLPIYAYARDDADSKELLALRILQGKVERGRTSRRSYAIDPEEVREGYVTSVDRRNLDGIATEPDALGYSLYYEHSVMNHRHGVSPLAVDGVAPTRETIASGAYPLVTNVYVVTVKNLPPDSPAAKVRDWLLSPDGQRLIADSGYVPL